MKYLSVFEDVRIPVDYAPIQKYVTLGASDSGKTYLLARFAEQCAAAGIFFVILDPVGKHWSLRAGPDGSPDGGIADVYVLGGLHGDLPLDPKSGALIADVVVDHPGRYVIDVSTFETDSDVHTFADAFARRLFRRKAKDPGWPMLLMLEESENFLPQQPQPGQQKMKGAFGRIVRQGRNHGIGVYLVFQRSAAGDKGAISQCKVLIAKQMSHKRDRDAVDDWVESNGTKEQRDEMMGALASLHVDEAYVWDPSWMRVFARTRVLPRATFDASANVKHGERMAAVDLVPLDVEALGRQIQALAERAKESDPTELHKRIAGLERELAERDRALAQADTTTGRAPEPEQIEVPVLDPALVQRLEAAVAGLGHPGAEITEAAAALSERLGDAAKRYAEGAHELTAAGAEITDALRAHDGHAPLPAPASRPAVPRSRAARPIPAAPAPARVASVNGDEESAIPPARQKLLDALLDLEGIGVAQAPKPQLALWAGVSAKSSGYDNNLGGLRTLGLLDYPTPGMVALTPGGRAQATPRFAAPRSNEELHAQVRQLLPPARWRIMEVLIAAYPKVLSKDDLADQIGVSARSSGYDNNLGGLRTLGLLGYPQPRLVVASDLMFPFA